MQNSSCLTPFLTTEPCKAVTILKLIIQINVDASRLLIQDGGGKGDTHTEGFTDKTIAESELNWTEEDMWDCKTAR